MAIRRRRGLLSALVLGALSLTPLGAGAAEGPAAGASDPQLLAQGRWIYEANCAICHGVRGDGRGMAAHMFLTPPRDFTRGIFKFRSTPSGSIPTDDDLARTITRGLRGTPMVAQPQLTRGLYALIAYLKTFSTRFSREIAQPPMVIPAPPERDETLLSKGRQLYVDAGCDSCHGSKGLGDGPSAGELSDVWGHAIRPSNLTTPSKRGSSPAAIYQTLVTGLDGTPMPSYQGALSNEQLWALSFYVSSLNRGVLSFQQRQEELRGRQVLMMHGGMMGGSRMR